MKILLDFLALILFFAVYFTTRDIFLATGVAIVAGILQAVFIWLKFKRLETMQWVSLGLIVVFGGLTVLLRNDNFIIWKASLLFWAMAAAVGGGLLLKKNTLKALLGKEITLPNFVWLRLSLAWTIFFTLLGIINLLVAYHYSRDVWVTYKTFGAMGLMITFFIAQAIYMAKYLPQDTPQS
ncbi:MAG: septation protein A [Neisseria sp.]|nr:septation protein A [Neisseria sp.]